MSQENVDRLRRAYDAYCREDFNAAVESFHPGVEFFPPGGQPPYRSIESFRPWRASRASEKISGTTCRKTIDARELLPAADERVSLVESLRGSAGTQRAR